MSSGAFRRFHGFGHVYGFHSLRDSLCARSSAVFQTLLGEEGD